MLTGCKILIVDDNADNIRLAIQFLKEVNKYDLHWASNGDDALKQLGSITYDLVLLDIMMPDMDGFEVCQAIKKTKLNSTTPIVFLTALNDTDYITRAFDLGAADYIIKPFRAAELQARVKAHLSVHMAQKLLQQTQKQELELQRQKTALSMAITANHELNQPLMVVQGAVDIIKMQQPHCTIDAVVAHQFTLLDESVQKMSEILKKYSQSDSVHFENYNNDGDMVVFDTEPEQE